MTLFGKFSPKMKRDHATDELLARMREKTHMLYASPQQQGLSGLGQHQNQMYGSRAAYANIQADNRIIELMTENGLLMHRIQQLEQQLAAPSTEEVKKLRATNKKLVERINRKENDDL